MVPPFVSFLKAGWIELPDAFFEPMRFGELEIGQKFIFLPSPGDNMRQKGFRISHRVFTKKQQWKGVETAPGMPFGKAEDSQGNSYIFEHSLPVILLAE